MTYQRRLWRSRQRWHTGAATALVAALTAATTSLAATSSPASAGSAPGANSSPATTVPLFGARLDQVKAQAAKWVAERISSLDKEILVVKSQNYLGADGVALIDEMQADITGLESLGAKIEADTTLEQALADSELIFTEFRVYRLMLPVAGDVMYVDKATNVRLPDLSEAITWLEGQENPSDQDVLGPLVANMQSQGQIAGTATSGLSAELLSYTPAEWDANHNLLNGAQAEVAIAGRAVLTEQNDANEAYKYLSHHHTPPNTTTTTTTSPTSTSTTSTTAATTTTTGSGNLEAIQAWAAKEISERLASLEGAIQSVDHDSFLGSDGAALVSEMQAGISGLEALATKIAGDTTASQAQADAELIFSQFRVYSLMIPVVHDVVTVDYIDNVKLGAIGKDITYLQGRENAYNQAWLAPLISNMQLQVPTATSATAGLTVELLGYTPAEWDANAHLLAGANANIFVAERAVQTAERDFTRAELELRSYGHHRR